MTTYDDLLAHAVRLMTDLDRPPVVAISGHGGAGKSTLSSVLAADLGCEEEQVVRLDRLYAERPAEQRGLFDLHDWPAVVDLLRRVRIRPTPDRLAYPTRGYDGSTGRRDTAMPPVVLVEGIRLLRPELRRWFDLAVWIEMTPEAAGARAVARNTDQGDSAEELDLWRTRWIPEGHAYAAAVDPARLADLVVTAAGKG
jgi:uridine kinase